MDLAIGQEKIPGAGRIRAGRTANERLLNFVCHLREHGREEVLLVSEVVVERPSGEASLADYFLGEGGLKALGCEEVPRRSDEGTPSVLDMCR